MYKFIFSKYKYKQKKPIFNLNKMYENNLQKVVIFILTTSV